MAKTASDLLFDRLIDWGVDTIFGLPGDGINGIMGAMGAMDRAGDRFALARARHEEMCAFMACVPQIWS